MNEKENELIEEIENQQENDSQIEESHVPEIDIDKSIGSDSIIRMQAPERWPDPPQESEESDDEE